LSLTTILGLVAAFFTTFANLPQALRAIRTKHTKDLSIYWIVMVLIGVLLWLVYGFIIDSLPVILANAVSFFLVAVILILKIKYE